MLLRSWLAPALLVVTATPAARAQQSLTVAARGPIRSLAQAVAQARPGSSIVVQPGTYRVTRTIVIDKPLSITGVDYPVLDGGNGGEILRITADSVRISGLVIRNVGVSYVEDRAGIKVDEAYGCEISDNVLENTFFAIYLLRTSHCAILRNRIVGTRRTETASGNGIHLWYSRDIVIRDNHIRGHRDGIYFEWVRGSRIVDNISERNLRYGLHFMFSDSCTYTGNTFQENAAGVAVMYTRNVTMQRNRILSNRGSAVYGLLLKDIRDSRIEHNELRDNTIGIYLDGSSHVEVRGNELRQNGWAVKVLASSTANMFQGNRFVANTFDVAANSRMSFNTFRNNYWDAYRGYDLNRDGYGDVPHRPVRMFSILAEQHPPALILTRSLLLHVLDLAERAFPALTPAALQDERPLMRASGAAR